MSVEEGSGGFSKEERAAMRERAAELKAEAKAAKSRADGEAAVAEKIAELEEPERSMAQRLHELIEATAPELMPKTWYGMQAYALGDKVVCFFQSAGRFKTRYATLGFSDTARLDDGDLWPTSYALQELTPEVASRIAALVKRAVGE